MLKTFLRTALVASCLAIGVTTAQASSVGNAHLTLGSTGSITVIAEDGQNYSKLQSTDLNFHGSVQVTMSTGKVIALAIYNGACGGLCPNGIGYKLLFADQSFFTTNLDKDLSFSVSADDYPQGLTQNLEASKIFQACHGWMTGSFITSDVTFTHLMKVTLALDLDEEGDFSGPGEIDHDWWDDFTVPVQVTCKALDQPQMPGGMVQEMGEFKTTGIDLFLTTFADATTQPNPATTCQKGRILVRVKTSKAGPAKFKLWTQVGNGPITSKVVDAWSSHDGNGAFKAEHIEWVSVGEPTPVQAMAEDMVNSVGQTTQWKDITLQCTGTGGGKGGGLTVGNDEPMLPGLNLTGDFSYVDVGSPKCTRTGKALISFTSNRPDNIHYSLDCTNGQHFSGYVTPVQVPQGGHIAAATQTFQIDKTSVYSCALKTVQPGPVKLHKWKGHTFECVKSTGVSGSDDLAPDTNPERKKPDKPALAAKPPIACADGQVKNGKCACRNGFTPVATGPNDFRCQLAALPVPLPALPLLKLVPSPKSKPKIACAGGKVSKGKCVCPKGLTPVSAGGSAFRCTRLAQAPAVKTAPKAVIVPKLPDLRKLFGQ